MVPCRLCSKCKIKDEKDSTLYYRRRSGSRNHSLHASHSECSREKAYGSEHEIEWIEVLAGERAFNETGSWLPDETMEAFKKYGVGIKGPLTTPVGGGIRSLNVALRQTLDLYVCLRPVRWFSGVVSPVKEPQKVDMHIFRENTEDIYAGIEWEAGTPEAEKFYRFCMMKWEWLKCAFPKVLRLA